MDMKTLTSTCHFCQSTYKTLADNSHHGKSGFCQPLTSSGQDLGPSNFHPSIQAFHHLAFKSKLFSLLPVQTCKWSTVHLSPCTCLWVNFLSIFWPPIASLNVHKVNRWPAPHYNCYFDLLLLICTSFVFRARGIVCVVYLVLIRLVNHEDPRKNGVWSPKVNYFKTCN